MTNTTNLSFTVHGYDQYSTNPFESICQVHPNHIVILKAGPSLKLLGIPVAQLLLQAQNFPPELEMPVLDQTTSFTLPVPAVEARTCYPKLVKLTPQSPTITYNPPVLNSRVALTNPIASELESRLPHEAFEAEAEDLPPKNKRMRR